MLAFLVFGGQVFFAHANKDQPNQSLVAKIKVHPGGGISLDGRSISLEDLRPRLDKLKAVNGVVWYYRESPDKNAEEKGEAVIKMIIELKLPVRLMDKDFE